MTTANNNFSSLSYLNSNLNLSIGGGAQISQAHAASAAALLTSFNFSAGISFSATEVSSFSGATAMSAYAGLAVQPRGYSAAAVGGAFSVFAGGFSMSASGSYSGADAGWSLHGFGGFGGFCLDLGALESYDRLCTMQMRSVVSQIGVMAKNLSGMLAPQKPDATDKFATGQTCRTGKHNPCNLTNADHITLAIYDILKGNQEKGVNKAGRPGGMSFEALAKQLEEKYGIKAEVTTVKSKEGDKLKALKFEGGQVFADGAGDGQADLGDYDFKNAVADIQSRTGMTRESFAAGAAEFKLETTEIAKLRKDLETISTEATSLYKKLGDDFKARWGHSLDMPPPRLPTWVMGMFGGASFASLLSSSSHQAESGAYSHREMFRGGLDNAFGMFAVGFMFASSTEVH